MKFNIGFSFIQWMSDGKIKYYIYWVVIYQLDSSLNFLNNLGFVVYVYLNGYIVVFYI